MFWFGFLFTFFSFQTYSAVENKVKNNKNSNDQIKIPEFPEINKKIKIDKSLLEGNVENSISSDVDYGRAYDKFYLESDSKFFYQKFQRGTDESVYLTDKIYAGTINKDYGDDYPTTYRSRILVPTTITLDDKNDDDESIAILYFKR